MDRPVADDLEVGSEAGVLYHRGGVAANEEGAVFLEAVVVVESSAPESSPPPQAATTRARTAKNVSRVRIG